VIEDREAGMKVSRRLGPAKSNPARRQEHSPDMQ
jgi:hypothetical protein